MNRKQLVAQALQASKHAEHNLNVIRENPDKILPGRQVDAEAYLNKMISFAEEEMKNARQAGRTSLRTRLKYLVSIILSPSDEKRKEGTV
ncbi:hypothetical protein [Paenibacillus sp. OSY-SE]|uniref:hypothetical protein n=1 Tax=Paenibacillus sp. OSY-SE TaxID=1196323 RepID=UPI0002E1A8A7|nr:hypothetical protein [Paenibacillus sp. OSY-SE]